MSFSGQLYLDSVSSTKLDPEVLKAYKKVLDKYYANSSALHKLGVEVNNLEEKSKAQVLDLLDLKHFRLIFTSGATEANNIAIKSIALKNQHLGKHLITSEIEHPSVYNSFKFLEDYLGFEVSYLSVNEAGEIDLKDLRQNLRADTILVSIMSVNNEIGTIINPQTWASVVKKHSRALTHVDMVQALGKLDLDFTDIDMASFSAHKINGVNGSGFLIIRDHLKLVSLISGGSQQDGFRAGTTNAAANIVLAKTVRLALENKEENNLIIKQLSTYLYNELELIPEITLNSRKDKSINNIINFSVKGVESEIMLNALSNSNIFVSAGSTCQSDIYKDSRVLDAINKDTFIQRSRVRISLDASLSMADAQYFIKKIKEIISKYAI